MPKDPLQREDVAATHDEVAREHVPQIVDPDPRQLRAFERTVQDHADPPLLH